MGREKGAKNLSLREQRLAARIEALKVENRAQKEKFQGKLRVKDARIRELRSKVKG
jgi:hypothetical protein